MNADRQTVDAAGAPPAIGPYSHAVTYASQLFCSGMLPLAPATGELVSSSLGAETKQCLNHLEAVCAAAGTTLSNALRLTIYTTNLELFEEINEAYAAFFPDSPPARAAIGVAALPKGARIEIDAVVAVPE